MSGQQEEKCVRVRLEGRVQGVWFRAWTAEEATHLGLRGWVRNRADGSVEAQFAGAASRVDAMVEACRRGPPLARVERLISGAVTDDGEPGFRQLPTA
ncbi:MAG TPA: acylphosphatase [Alphaproteobacteria bacterium]|nr:acylphosphatase [Alphaproteobacteria bacterium]